MQGKQFLRPAARLLAFAVLLYVAGPAFAAQPFTLNLKDADIESLISTVSSITGKNFVVDPRVKGKVTVISSSPTDPRSLYNVFLSILQVNGYAAVPSGKVIKIVPAQTAKQDAAPFTPAPQSGAGDAVVTAVFKLRNVPAATLVPILRPLMPQSAHLAADPAGNVLVAADTARNVARLEEIVRRVDESTNTAIDVIPLQHADAADLVRVLTPALRRPPQGEQAVNAPKLIADERTNTILLSGDTRTRLELRALIAHLDTPVKGNGNTEVVYLHYADAKNLLPILQALYGGGAATGAKRGGPAAGGARGSRQTRVEIQADEATNALVIQAPPNRMHAIRSVVRKLDVRRAQVLVDAIIAEVSSTKAAELGVQWRSTFDSNGTFAGTTLPGTASGSIDSFPGNPVALGEGLTLGYFSGGSIRALLRALSGDQDTNVLSTPSLVTLDNEEAEIVVGQNVPFVTGQYTNTGAAQGATTPFQTIQRQDVGIVLKVKPQINEGNAVRLSISQEVSSVAPNTTGADLVTNKRSIKTNVLVDNGRIVVLGGLIQNDLKQNVQKVPLLGDIPLLGSLFRNTRTDHVKTNLMVFLRPEIIRSADTGETITASRYDYIRRLQSAMAGQYRYPLMHEASPMLPPMKEHTPQRKPSPPPAKGLGIH